MSTVANFATGQGNYDATLVGGPTLDSSANVGTGDLSLNAVASQYMASTTTWTPPAVTAGNGISFSGWFYPAAYGGATYQSAGATLFDISGTSTSVSMYCDGTGKLIGNFNGNTVTCPVLVRNNSGATTYGANNGWHFFCYTIFCTAAGTALQSIYLDASCVPGLNQATTANTTGYVQITSAGTNYIGYGTGQGATPWAYFNGKIDDFRFYNRVLTPPEISVLYQYNYKSNTTPTIAAQLNYDVSYSNAVQIDVSGTFSGLDVSRNPTFSASLTGGAASIKVSAASLQLVGDSTWAYVDTTVSPDTSYSYTIKPYIMNTYGSTTTALGSITTTPVLNGFFNQNATLPLDSSYVTVQTGTTTVNALAGWTVANANVGAIVELERGVGWITDTSYAAYRGTLPSTVTYWLAMRGQGTSGGYSQITQNVGIYTGTSGFLSFYAWPLDASAGGYSSAHTFSVSLGGMTLLNNYSFASNSGNFAPTNLNFNLPAQSANASVNSPTLPGWKFYGTAAAVAVANGTSGYSFASYTTSQWLLVQFSTVGQYETITQPMSFPVGTYTLTFVVAMRPYGIVQPNIILMINIGNNSIFSRTFNGAISHADDTWTTYTATFSIASEGTYPLSVNFSPATTGDCTIGFTISSISPVPTLTSGSTDVTNSIMTNYNFASPVVATNSLSANRPTILGWSYSGPAIGIFVANGTGLPFTFTSYTTSQWLLVQTPGTGTGTTLTQTVTLPVGTYTLSYNAAVRNDGSTLYASNITLSILVGANSVYSKTFLQADTARTTYTTTFSITTAGTYPLAFNLTQAAAGDTSIGFTVLSLTYAPRTSTNGVPYTSFSLPFSMTRAGTYPLTITSNCNGMTSGFGVSAVQVRMQDTTALGIGYKTIDPSNLALYYNFDTSFASATAGAVSLYDSSNGTVYSTATLDASMVNGATISSSNPASLMGVNSLYLPGGSSYAQIAKWTLGAAAVGQGFSVCGWVYRSAASPASVGFASTIESSNATIATFGTTDGSCVSIFLNQRTGCLDFSCNVTNGPEFIATQTPVQPQMWNFFAMTCSCLSATASASQCVYNFYQNDVLLQSMPGAWPNRSSVNPMTFVNNYLGGTPVGVVIMPNSAGPLEDLSGNLDDFRVYNRALSKGDIDALWSYGFALNQYANLIDPTGLGMYYPMDPGSDLLYLPSGITMSATTNITANSFVLNWTGGAGSGVSYSYGIALATSPYTPFTTFAASAQGTGTVTITGTGSGFATGSPYVVTVYASSAGGTVSGTTVVSPIVFQIKSVTNFSASDASGTSTSNGINYQVYAFKTVTTPYVLTYSSTVASYVYVLAVGGGGGGASGAGGGGGAGGVVMMPVLLPSSSGLDKTITVTVGPGGSGNTTANNFTGVSNGSNTTIVFSANNALNVTANGGGLGGGTTGGNAPTQNGGIGGSGGGSIYNTPGTSNNNYNNYGNVGVIGGGGAGTNANTNIGGNGIKCFLPGISLFSPSGTAYGSYYWGGGGGGSSGGLGGLGGGGGASIGASSGTGAAGGGSALNSGATGGNNDSFPAVSSQSGSGGANTGGGGAGSWNGFGGAGGSGIVVIAFPLSTIATNAQAVLPLTLYSSGVYRDVLSVDSFGGTKTTTLTAAAYSSIKGGFSCKLINYNYFGPIMTLRYNTDTCGNYTQNFYADVCGNMGTGYLGTGQTLSAWLTANVGTQSDTAGSIKYAFVTKWYNQGMDVCFNCATQYALGSQPIYDVSNGFINYGLTNIYGGYSQFPYYLVGSNAQWGSNNGRAYFNLPNGALPYGDSSYTYVIRTGGNMPNVVGGMINGGTSDASSKNCLAIRTSSYSTTGSYLVYWAANTVTSSTISNQAANVITAKYTSGVASDPFYVNGTLDVTGTLNGRTQGSGSNFIGVTNTTTTSPGSEYYNGYIHNLYVFNTSIAGPGATTDQGLIEQTPYGTNYVGLPTMTLTIGTVTATNFVLSTSTVTNAAYFVVYINGSVVYTSATANALTNVTVSPTTSGPWNVNVYAYNATYGLLARGYLSIPIPIPTTVSTNGLPILYYPFWNDIKDYANNTLGTTDATLSNANIYYASNVGYKGGVGALYNSTGTGTTYMSLPLTVFSATTGYSFSCWFKMTSYQTVGNMIFTANSSVPSRMYLWIKGTGRTLVLESNGVRLDATFAISDNTWYHIVWNIPSTGTSYVYINGGSVNSGTTITVGTNMAMALTTNTAFYLLCDTGNNPGMIGNMNNFYLFNRTLSQAEITALWQQ